MELQHITYQSIYRCSIWDLNRIHNISEQWMNFETSSFGDTQSTELNMSPWVIESSFAYGKTIKVLYRIFITYSSFTTKYTILPLKTAKIWKIRIKWLHLHFIPKRIWLLITYPLKVPFGNFRNKIIREIFNRTSFFLKFPIFNEQIWSCWSCSFLRCGCYFCCCFIRFYGKCRCRWFIQIVHKLFLRHKHIGCKLLTSWPNDEFNFFLYVLFRSFDIQVPGH